MSPSVTKLLDLIETGAVSAQNASEAIRQAGGTSLCVLEAVRTLAEGGGASSFGELSGEPEDNEALSGALEERAGLTENTFTGAQVVEMNALGTTMTPGVSLVNTTAAVSGTQQASPALMFAGSGWKTSAIAASQQVQFGLMAVPLQGSSAPSGLLRILHGVNEATPGAALDIEPLYNGVAVENSSASGGMVKLCSAEIIFGRKDGYTDFASLQNYGGFPGLTVLRDGVIGFGPSTGGVGGGNSMAVAFFTSGASNTIQMGGTSGSPTPQLFKGPDGTGPATVGGDLRLAPGRSTGSATPAKVVLQGTSGDGSSGAAQALVDVLTVRGHDNIMLGAAHEEPVCLQSWSGTLPGITLGASGDKLGFFGGAPVSQPVVTDIVGGHTAGAGAAVTVDSTFTGNVGTGAYTIGDIVFALKSLGLIAT